MYVLIFIIVIVIVIVISKLFIKFTTGVYRGKETLAGKTVIVTGANTGIGFVSAKKFATRGARVVMVCRDLKKAENAKIEIIKETGNSNIQIYQVDFSSLDSVRKGANEILKYEDKIDVLLNNAGIAYAGFSEVSEEGLNIIMLTNYFGPFLFTNILLGKIKKSAPSRIVNVSSMVHRMGDLNKNNFKNIDEPYKHHYENSKLANILFTKELARKLQGTAVTANTLHPGVFASEIMRDRGPLYRFIYEKILPFMLIKSVEEGAQTSIYLCLSRDVENISGEYFSECKLTKSSKQSMDSDFARELWNLTEEAVNLQPSEKHYL